MNSGYETEGADQKFSITTVFIYLMRVCYKEIVLYLVLNVKKK
jgi:hypothetical protein